MSLNVDTPNNYVINIIYDTLDVAENPSYDVMKDAAWRIPALGQPIEEQSESQNLTTKERSYITLEWHIEEAILKIHDRKNGPLAWNHFYHVDSRHQRRRSCNAQGVEASEVHYPTWPTTLFGDE